MLLFQVKATLEMVQKSRVWEIITVLRYLEINSILTYCLFASYFIPQSPDRHLKLSSPVRKSVFKNKNYSCHKLLRQKKKNP